jgi:GNAT superfamily N-acetyltransferase
MSNRLVEVRQATWADATRILPTLELAREAAETPWPAPELPYAIQYTMDLANQGLMFVAVVSDDIVGTIILDAFCWPWNRQQKYLTNVHFWIERPYRSGGTAQRLLTEAKRVADHLQMPLMIELSSGGIDQDLKDRFVRMHGFKPVGGKFYRLPKEGD